MSASASPDPNDTSIAYEPPAEERPASASPTEPQLEDQRVPTPALDYAPPPPPHDPYAALRFRDYRLYLFGWAAAVLGMQMQAVAVQWQVYQWTGSAMSLGWVGLAQAVPTMLLALPAGQLADWFDRRRVVMFSTLGAALCTVSLAGLVSAFNHGLLTLNVTVPLVYAILLLGSTAATLGRPARAALLPLVVPPAIFNNAVTWNSSVFEICSMLGPAIGGFFIALNVWGTLLGAAAMELVFVAALFLLHSRPSLRSNEPPGWASLLAGLKFVFSREVILASLTLDLFAVLLGGATFLLPVFAKDILHVGPWGFGWLRAAPAIGAFSMAILQAHLPPLKRAGHALLWAVAGFGAATIVFGLSPWYPLSLVALLLTGVFDNISVVVRHTLVQLLTPDRMRGRVSAVNAIFIGASNELGGFESGLTAALFGPVISVVGGGLGTLAVVGSVAWAWPQVRQLGSLRDIKPADETNN